MCAARTPKAEGPELDPATGAGAVGVGLADGVAATVAAEVAAGAGCAPFDKLQAGNGAASAAASSKTRPRRTTAVRRVLLPARASIGRGTF
jgi:hypothetical protein